ncbi:MAG: hypothetical protein Q9163_000377 [Psora crenata]
MTSHGEKEEELEPLEDLEEIDVTGCADDDDELKRRFEEKTGCTNSRIETWVTAGKEMVRQSQQENTAVVIKLNDKSFTWGTVKFFLKGKYLGVRTSRREAKERAVMVFLGDGHCFWPMGFDSINFAAIYPTGALAPVDGGTSAPPALPTPNA